MNNLNYAYMELTSNQNIKNHYQLSDGFQVYDKNSLEIYIFRATDYKHIAIVKRWYGNYKVREL